MRDEDGAEAVAGQERSLAGCCLAGGADGSDVRRERVQVQVSRGRRSAAEAGQVGNPDVAAAQVMGDELEAVVIAPEAVDEDDGAGSDGRGRRGLRGGRH
jgi:hypothetical protein